MSIEWRFFHNKYDNNSKDALDYILSLANDDVALQVVDVFSIDNPKHLIPYTPYLMNKSFSFEMPEKHPLGIISLQFMCIGPDGKKMSRSGIPVNIDINNVVYLVKTVCGEVGFDLIVNTPSLIDVKLESEEFFPLEINIEVG